MSRIEDVKAFARCIPRDEQRIRKNSTDFMIDAIVATVHKQTGLDRAILEEGITEVSLRRRGQTFTLRVSGGFGHGPIPIPHDCHEKIVLCWQDPEGEPGELLCLEIEYPWPCPDSPWPWPF